MAKNAFREKRASIFFTECKKNACAPDLKCARITLEEIFPFTTMKKHHFLSFLKGAALACLSFAVLSGICLTLTSCGGGSSDDEPTDVARAAKRFEYKTLKLIKSAGPTCTIVMGERTKGTGMLYASSIRYGDRGSTVDGWVTVTDDNTIVTDDRVDAASIMISPNSGSLADEDDYKLWWGQATAEGDGNLAVTGAIIFIHFENSNPSVDTGTYDIYMQKEGEEEPLHLFGSVRLER